MPSRKITGKDGKFSSEATDITITKWSLDDGNDLQDVTGSESGGGHEYEAGLDNWSGSAEGVWDAAIHIGGPPNLVPGQKIDGVFTMVDGESNAAYSGVCSVEKVKIETVIEGKVTFSIDFKGNGSLTRPSAAIDA